MAIKRERPYAQFNFLVQISGEDATAATAGFQEVSGLGLEISVSEYRAGNFATNAPIKITGLSKTPDITLKRGLMGSLDLYNWINEVRNGSQAALKSVTVMLQSEDRTETVQAWKLMYCRPIKYTGPALNGKGSDVAIEELVLSCERIELE